MRMIDLLWRRRRRPPPPVNEKRLREELDPRPAGCDCGRDAEALTPDSDGHSWRCKCGLVY